MFTITGEIINVFFASSSEKYPEASYLVQVLGDNATENGLRRKEIVTMSVSSLVYEILKNNVGKMVNLPVGLSISHGKIQPFVIQFSQDDCKAIDNCLYIEM